MKLTKKMITLTTILLTFALLLTSAPLGVIAQGTDTLTEDATPPQTKQAQATDATELAPVVSEVIDRREETVKHFDMGDGTFRAVSYGYPVHKRDAGGTWQSIDNTLSLLSGATYYGTADARVQFAKSPSTGTFLTRIAENGYEIKTTLLTANASPDMGSISATDTVVPVVRNTAKPTVLATDDIETQFNKLKAVNQPSEITYVGILNNVDIEYIINNTSVKENIIVNAPRDNYTFTFKLEITGLVATLTESGSILLSDDTTDNTVYTMPTPFMFDASNIYSNDVYYELQQVKSGVYLLSIVANEDWINNEGRAFPVTIDPVVNSQFNICNGCKNDIRNYISIY